jgi:hypothetical protein
MADSITTISNIVENSVPKITIQRIVLETGATENRTIRDPHIITPNQFKSSYSTGQDEYNQQMLKINLTLSLEGYKKRNVKGSNLLSNIFDNLDLMSLLKTCIYQIDEEDLANLGVGAGLSNMFGSPLGVGTGVTYQEVYTLIKNSPAGFYNYKKEIDIVEELTSMTEADLSRFEYRASDGSTLYNFPFKIDTFISQNPNPKFLAYLIVTEVDNAKLINHIKATIGGSSDYQLPTEVEEYLETLNVDISNKAISFDVVFNNNTLNDKAALLQRTDNEEFWFGSYHEMNDGTLMTGDVHNDQSIEQANRDVVLRPVLMANTKVVDLRDDEEIEKVFLKELYELENVFETIQKTTNQSKTTTEKIKLELPEKFSTSYMSKKSNGIPSYLFGIDKLKILANKSLLSGIGQNLLNSNSFLNNVRINILENTSVKELKVSRRRVKVNNFGTNRLGTLNAEQESFKHNVLDADIENSYEDVLPQKVAILKDGLKKIEALNFLSTGLDEKRYLFYSFDDFQLNQSQDGNYEYFYEIVMEDGILKVLTEKLNFLSLYHEDIKSYYNFINANIENCYDDLRDQFKFNFLENQGYGSIGDVLTNVTGHITDIMKMFNTNDLSSYSQMQKKLLLISNPISGNMQGLIKFINICETFIAKIQNMSGVRTGLKKYLDLAVTNLNNSVAENPNTIKIKETFPDNFNLEDANAGYEYIIVNNLVDDVTKGISANSIRTIPASIYLSMANAQLQENFSLDATNNSTLGNINNPNKLRYFTPTQVFINNRQYLTNSQPSIDNPNALKPFRLDFNYYKPIILDIVEYYLNKNIGDKATQTGIRNNIRRLIDIAARYGVIFDNNFISQLDFLSDPAKNEDSGKYSDSSVLKNNQQQTSKNENISGITEGLETDNGSDYEDNSYEEELNPNIENFLFGMLSNIILKDENLVPTIYQEPYGLTNYFQLPFCLQSLIVQFSSQATPLQQYLAGLPQLGFNLLKELPLSLNTIGWWWLNYSNIVEVRYIESYDSLFNPVWAPLTSESFNNTVTSASPKRIICKLFKYENSKWGVTNNNEFLDLPILNKYFIIDPEEAAITATAEEEGLLAINQEDEEDLETNTKQDLGDMEIFGDDPSMKAAQNLDPKLQKNNNAVKLKKVKKETGSLSKASKKEQKFVNKPTVKETGKEKEKSNYFQQKNNETSNNESDSNEIVYTKTSGYQ